MSKPFLSVIVPTYNVVRYIDRCISSILNQTFVDFELIIIDDCSTDGTLKKLYQVAERDQRIRLYENERNSGQGFSRNRGISLSLGKYITFVDSDDYLDSRMYEVLVNVLKDAVADIARCPFVHVLDEAPADEKPIEKYDTIIYEGDELARYRAGYFGPLPDESLSACPSASPVTALYSGGLIRDQGICFPADRSIRSEDLFFNIDAYSHAHRVVEINLPLYRYFIRPGSTSRSYSSPLGKCHLLSMKSPHDIEFKLRLVRSDLTAVKEASIQLAQIGESLFESARILRGLERDLGLADRLADYPIAKLPPRERMFAYAVRFASGIPEIIMAKIDRLRSGNAR